MSFSESIIISDFSNTIKFVANILINIEKRAQISKNELFGKSRGFFLRLNLYKSKKNKTPKTTQIITKKYHLISSQIILPMKVLLNIHTQFKYKVIANVTLNRPQSCCEIVFVFLKICHKKVYKHTTYLTVCQELQRGVFKMPFKLIFKIHLHIFTINSKGRRALSWNNKLICLVGSKFTINDGNLKPPLLFVSIFMVL